MLMTVEELRKYIQTEETDEVLVAKLSALELLIRKYTNNNFQRRAFRRSGVISAGTITLDGDSPFNTGDTVQITQSDFNDGLYVVETSEDNIITVSGETIVDEADVLITKVYYPSDVKMGAANMIYWDLNNRKKVGIQSETISRHSVTYFNMDGDNSLMGYPKNLVGFLKPYQKARF